MKKLKDIAQLLKPGYILLFAGLIILIGFLTIQYESWRTITYIIPPGVATGEATINLPDEIVLTVGMKDTLVIENRDNVIHSFGPFIIGPESTFRHRFRSPRLYQAACTFHPNQQMSLVINPAPWSTAFWSRNTAAE